MSEREAYESLAKMLTHCPDDLEALYWLSVWWYLDDYFTGRRV